LNAIPLVLHAPARISCESNREHADRVMRCFADGFALLDVSCRHRAVRSVLLPSFQRFRCQKLGRLESLLFGKGISAFADEENVLGFFHDGAGDGDGLLESPQACHAAAARGRKHDAGVEADVSRSIRPAPRPTV
jgi:hypothetical protein